MSQDCVSRRSFMVFNVKTTWQNSYGKGEFAIKPERSQGIMESGIYVMSSDD